ncbi:MAG: hypothetical protein HS127_18990 [Planctomycetia bacterium]|nr:hypothetical protein [Planctomycetia bacterium]
MRLDKGQIEVVDDKVAEILRGKTGMERLQIVWDLWTYFQKSLRAYLKTFILNGLMKNCKRDYKADDPWNKLNLCV